MGLQARHARSRWLVAVCLFLPILAGAAVMLAGGAAVSRWGVHLASAAIGLALYLTIPAISPKLTPRASLIAASCGVAVMASTLLGAGIEGVHRWHALGPVRLHPSAWLAPALLVFAARRLASQPLQAHAVLAGAQVIHILQPDAGQATAFGTAAAVCTLVTPSGRYRYLMAPAYLASIAAAWLRPDPLAPAPFVEDIAARAFAVAPAAGVLALVTLIPFVLSPWVEARSMDQAQERAIPAAALVVYFGGSVIAPMFGEFPVPLLGFGASPVLGAFVGLGALRATGPTTALAPAEESA